MGELAQPPRTVIRSDQTLREVANAFALHGTTSAPVVDPSDPVRLLGMVDLDQLLHARRQDQYEEHHRQRHLLGGIGGFGGTRRIDDQAESATGKAVAGMTTIEIRDEREERSRYAVYLEGERIGFASCVQVHDAILLPYVEVDPERRDLGLGSMLVRRVLDDAREEGNMVIPLCPFARRWADLHPDYAVVVRKPKPGELGAMNSLVEADRTMRLLHREESKTLVVTMDPEAS